MFLKSVPLRSVVNGTFDAPAGDSEGSGEMEQAEIDIYRPRLIPRPVTPAGTFLFDGKMSYPGQPVERKYRQDAEWALRVMGAHGLGMSAPETKGFGLDGEEISLNEYRGRVVLVSFLATWCAPCLQAIPHERELLHRFDSSEFAIVGMNADDNIEDAIDAVAKHGITWRSLHVTDRRFVNNWTVAGYPTFCLLDREGRIVGL